ncbi:MAG: tRNA modification GTPase [Thermoguttaceae bacterium]|nr:tRNA modification GTPase [Thermoguttaceae bacterium]
MRFTQTDDTIVAISSPLTGAALGIVRLSGAQTIDILSACFGLSLDKPARATRLELPLTLDADASPLPASVYLWQEGHSYTGELSAEIHTIGSLPLLNRIVDRLIESGARAAQGGEFTFRAFLSGSLDLTQAEAVLGLIEASDETAFKTAARQLAGGFSSKLKSVRNELLDVLVYLEAGFDYAEEDLSYLTTKQLQSAISSALDKVQDVRHRLQKDVSAVVSNRVVLYGEPNAGKSSLLNALTGRQAAIVSNTPGSTRDYVTARVVWDGVPLEIVDTAGRRGAAPSSHYRAVDKNRSRWSLSAFSQLATRNSQIQSGIDSPERETVNAEESSIAAQAQELSNEQKDSADILVLCVPVDENVIHEDNADLIVRTKSDKAGSVPNNPDGELFCSAVTGDGIEELRQAIVQLVAGRSSGQTEILASTSQRCRELVQRAEEFLTAALDLCRDESASVPEELIAENLRLTLNALGEIVGEVCTDDILEGIFGRFCVGK